MKLLRKKANNIIKQPSHWEFNFLFKLKLSSRNKKHLQIWSEIDIFKFDVEIHQKSLP